MSMKLSGNGLWESSRMMLPEHKESINKYNTEKKKLVRTTLHEDEWETVSLNLNQSYSQKDEVSVVIFGEYASREVVGIVTGFNQFQKKFKVEFQEGFEWIDYSEIVSVTLV